ncbi:MAG TPA: protoporphyrinogen oxidase [Pirellulales bacterium]|jgi:oxygen-dependent protoporphyrinogen oxidase|nr:protoporphyrinogen oxidase [Pirellulales bacterium]
MNAAADPARRVAVVGGGIAGLAAAHRLSEIEPRPEVVIFEAAPQPGGVLQTSREDGYLLEASADCFITNVPWAVDLCRRIGLTDDLLPTDEARRRALVLHRGKLCPVPEGFMLMAPGPMLGILVSPLLSLRGKLRLLAERWIPPGPGGDESVAAFARRRLGREAFERLVQPLVGGIYTGDAERLSLAATLPRFLEMERRHGSLSRAVLRDRGNMPQPSGSGARYGLFAAPREGMGALVQALAARLPTDWLRLSTSVSRLEKLGDGRWQLETAAGHQPAFDGLILATPGHVSARLLADAAPQLSESLGKIPFAGSIVATLGYAREQIEHPLDAFGFVVPDIEQRDILAVSFTSQKFPGRAPSGHALLRVFLGGARRPEQLDLDDRQLHAIVCRELGSLLGARGEPQLFRVTRWPRAMPQYHLGHLELVAEIKQQAAALGNVELAGCALQGVGVPHCIHSGQQAAERLMGHPTSP